MGEIGLPMPKAQGRQWHNWLARAYHSALCAHMAGMTTATGIAIGVGIGAALGAAMDNMGVGIAFGIGIGIALSIAWKR